SDQPPRDTPVRHGRVPLKHRRWIAVLSAVAISGEGFMRRAWLVFACFVLVAVGGATSSSSSAVATFAITPAPAFTAAQLAAPAGDNWLSHMASLNGNRYSSLAQVTPANIATLKEAWHTNLGTCRTNDALCGSLESNAVVYAGTYYTQTPKGDVFALDA